MENNLHSTVVAKTAGSTDCRIPPSVCLIRLNSFCTYSEYKNASLKPVKLM